MNDALLEQLMRVFREEAAEELEHLAALLRKLREAEPSDIPAIAHDAMRVAHTIKGAASSVGHDTIAGVAHALEDVMQSWRGDPTPVPPDRIALCEEAVSVMAAILEGGPESGAGAIIAGLRGAQLGIATDGEAAPAATAQEPASAPQEDGFADWDESRSGTMRVDADRLDAVMGHAGDMVAVREELDAIREASSELHAQLAALVQDSGLALDPSWSRLLDGLDRVMIDEARASARFARVTAGLGEAVRSVRLVRFGTLAPLWTRAVSDAARRAGKRVRLQMSSQDVEIDKRLLDCLRDPGIHLLRNAVDHGIEPAAERAAAGKPAEGTITVRAWVSEGSLTVETADDGKGISLESIRETAVSGKRLTRDQATVAPESDLLALLFEPGFSTTDHVTSLSGRGVGLDLVRRAVEDSRGHAEALAHGPAGGAVFRLSVPLDLLSTRVLLVRCGEAVTAIPTDAVQRTMRVNANALLLTSDMAVLPLEDGNPLRVEALDGVLGMGARRRSGDLAMAVIAVGRRQLGLIVDEVLGCHDVVVKKLPWNVQRVDKVSGGCVLSGGQVALVLDPARMVLGAAQQSTRFEQPDQLSTRRVLVVDDSHTARTLARNALASAGWEVDVAVDGVQGWIALQKEMYRVLVTDIQMPGMDGFELTRKVRGDARLARLPVILVTSRSTREDVEKGLAVGADEYIVKGPLQQQQLIEAVGRHA
ncbi:MAG: response regulator [Deltaproteobacteria bacterium]|nr:response regulator [Deltaproteobacteria bacterium]